VIHIQDIHTNYEAQKNLYRMLEALVKDKGLSLIMVEGGWGNVNLSYLRAYADKERRHEVAEEYIKAGKITGEEYLDIVSDYDISLEGLEDEELYMANLDTFFEIEEFREKASKELERIVELVERLKSKIYPAQLMELEKAGREYEDEKISLADYYKHINLLAKKTDQDISALTNFNQFIGVTEVEKEIDFPRVEKERSKLIETLSKKLSKQKLAALVTKSLEFRLNKLTPAEYHSYLLENAKEEQEDLKKYPNLNKYVGYIESHETIDTTGLFEEAEEAILAIKAVLAKDARAKRLNEISSNLRVLDNFLNLKLIPNDFKYYKEHKNDFTTSGWIDFLKKLAKRHKIRAESLKPAYTSDRNLATLVRFYDIANQRDDIFVQNAIKLMNEKKQDLAVLIAGGFHTPSLKQKLRECGVSYIVVAPHTTEQTDPEQYRYILKYKAGKAE
ncbi:MAG: hypothetical protein HQ572_02500, partial [Candidatus Omnitrophica bacterium]|nr:hypothetical protein [Candidatus Omnitrophota bacterium]